MRKIIVTSLAALLGIVNLFPFIFMLSSSFKPLGKIFEYPFRLVPEPFIWDNYKGIFGEQYKFALWYQNSAVMVVLTLALKCAIVSITAYAFARLRFRGRDMIFLLFLAALMLPGDATIIQRYVIYKVLHLTDTVWAIALPAAFDVYFVFLLRQFFLSIPFELTEAAIIDGCGHFRVFYRIILPLAKPALMTMILFSFVWSWNDFTNPFIFITNMDKQMLTVGIAMFQEMKSQNYALQMAASSLALIPVVLLFMFSQQYFIKGIATSGIKG
ncbi:MULTISPECIES: carbohydrate ABC transporter permease [Cohnella]|uniref:Multiple sugar transport system permease protein n=1 Tax=Cohnella phaseoli TaxID=456490 RepID=A0A3D9HU18_9BACL|nr:carbohydrate ABC transporter permease [Cohnella phaseoli]RED52861.1 multiple sugar transport system permease protein [Cohnella phaseoli]